MKKFFVNFLLVLFPFILMSQNTKKVLVIGVDGCRPDALAAASTPNIDELIASGIYSADALNDDITISGPGWSAILCGVWSDKHLVTDNSFSVDDYENYPSFFHYAEQHDPSLHTVSICHWSPINDLIVGGQADFSLNVSSDIEVANQAVSYLNSNNPDLMFLHFDEADGVGHSVGFSTDVQQYTSIIEQIDGLIGDVVQAINDRSTYNEEDWLILMTTDHGGIGTSHGGSSIEEENVFLLASGKNINPDLIVKDSTELEVEIENCLGDDVELNFDGANDYVQIPNNPIFDFGENQDFTIECRVRTTTSPDVSIVGNKNWESGLNKGFVFSFKFPSGPGWKVNIGDGSNRADIDNGGAIADNQWHTLSVTFDRDGLMTMYQDGVFVDAADISFIGDIDTNLGLFIGTDVNGAFDFDGSISEVRVWNEVLEETNINQYFCSSIDSAHPQYSSLIGYWKLNEGEGNSQVNDFSPNNNPGTIFDAKWEMPDTILTTFDYANTPRLVDILPTALTHLCIPIEADWNLDGTSLISNEEEAEDCISEETEGYNMLLIGNSFFRPYAEKLDALAIEAGFENHNSTRITRGGENGRPINFWNDSDSNEHQQIKAVLDQGGVDIFGMTAGHELDNPTEGHRAWIDYALQNNPDITIFIAIPLIDFPADWDQRAEEFGFDNIHELYDFFVDDLVHNSIVDQLRIEFPSTKIFTIPTGRAGVNLDQMNMDNELLDDITRFGPAETSLFTDTKGHQGDIIQEAGSLLWLSSIYGVDLSTFDYDTGFNTDLHAFAEDIMNSHDPDYKLCFEESDTPVVQCDSTYGIILEEDITYAEGLSHDGISSAPTATPLLLDVYMPDNDSENRPVYMFIHGGGFNGGSKTANHIVAMADYFASRGWVFVSINYRTSENIGTIHTGIVSQEWEDATIQSADPDEIPRGLAIYAAQRDAKAAMRWIVANADNYNINTDYITVGGGSAGAITAVTLGISSQEDFRDEMSIAEDPTLATTNLGQSYEIQSIVDFWGSNIALEVLEGIYGHHRFDSNDPNLFIAHGTEDPVVLFSEAEELVHLYDSTGVHVELNTLVGVGHGEWSATLDGRGLFELSHEFLVAQQELILDNVCEEEEENSSALCTSDNRFTEVEYFSETEIDADLDVVYATDVIDWQGNTQDLAMDIYYPSLAVDPLENRPFVLLIHGGGFQIGTKEAIRNQCEEFAQRGYVAATMQYRLGWDTTTPIDQISAVYRANQDAHAAMRFVSENASIYNIDTDAMFIGGGSAGAITALNVIYIDQAEWNTGFGGVVSQLGPLTSSGNDLTNTFSIKGVFNNWGSNRVSTMQVDEMVPSIAFHGAMDNTVLIGESAFGAYGSGALHDLYQANGVCSEITVDPEGGHGIYLDAAGTEFRVARASCFFKSIFCDNCSSAYMEEQVFADCSTSTDLDNDGDGFLAANDCDDNNAAINPDATEIAYNGIDDDCDPMTLDDDLDQDGFVLSNDCDDNNAAINPDATEIAYNGIDDDCDPMTLDDDLDQDGFVLSNDCDDNNAAINPDATEIAYNGIDDDCDPTTLDDDLDQDGFDLSNDCDDNNAAINPDAAEIAYNGIDDDCDPTTLDDDLDQDGFVLAEDCDDDNSNIFPGASDIPDNDIDEDCDGVDATAFVDADGDGFTNEADCDDNDPRIFPGAQELCNGFDDNCDGQIDEGLSFETYYADADGDGFGNIASTMEACQTLTGYVQNSEDCDDTNANIYPGATDIPDNDIDEDCDGVDATAFVDADGDGFTNETDCDDNNPSIYPGAQELCNGIDDNCDGQIDEGLSFETYYADADGDGFGNIASTMEACQTLTGYVQNSEDCDDTNANIYPGATDIPDNGIDEDCDGVDGTAFVDADGDGFTNETDCDDNDPSIYPGAQELCNGIDDNCDGQIDEGLSFETYYADADGDGFGNIASTMEACQTLTGYVQNSEDCDDSNANIYPGATDIPDNDIDEDCDGVDATAFVDADGDGFTNETDCDDDDPNIYPGAQELCNGFDDNCDGQIDEGLSFETYYADADGDGFGNPDSTTEECFIPDGFVANNEDCDDSNPNINPGQTEQAYNGIDDDCNPATLDDDLDQDGFMIAEDCDDTDPSINPDAIEIPNNGIDEDCDGADMTTSTHEISNNIINIFPNPASDLIHIEILGQLDFEATIYDVNGRILYAVLNKNQLKVDLLPPGIYVLEIRDVNSGQRVIEKIVVER